MADGRTIRFRLGSYDRTRPLVIDPVVLAYSTYLGGSGFEIAYDIAVDSSGAYITGRTSSTNFNTVPGGNVEGDSTGTDAFVSKLNPAGNALAYSTYLGGNGADEAHAIAIDSLGFAYVVGTTGSTDFNTVNPIEGDQGGDDVFVSKLNPAGNTLAYSTYLGGSRRRSGRLRDRGRLDAGGRTSSARLTRRTSTRTSRSRPTRTTPTASSPSSRRPATRSRTRPTSAGTATTSPRTSPSIRSAPPM